MAAVIATVAVAAITVGSAYMQSENARKQAKTNFELAKINAERADLDAAEAKRAGVGQEVRAIGQMDQMRDSQIAAVSASGAEESGTVKSLIAENNLNSALNFLDLQEQTLQNELRYKREASDIRSQAAINRAAGEMQADNIMLSGYASAANTGLGGYYNYKNNKKGK